MHYVGVVKNREIRSEIEQVGEILQVGTGDRTKATVSR